VECVLANIINRAEFGVDVCKDFRLKEVNFGLSSKRKERALTKYTFTAYFDGCANVLHVSTALT
jgi:hypothetical protein